MKTRLMHVDPESIRVLPQVRKNFDEKGLMELAASIESVGLLAPPLCCRREDGLVLIDGERRLRAWQFLARGELPVLVIEGEVTQNEAATSQLVCNLQREDLAPVERAEGIRALMVQGSLSAEQVAAKLGISVAAVSRSLALLKLPEAIRNQVAAGKIAADAAYQLSRVESSEEQASLAAEVVAGSLTRDGLAKKLRRTSRGVRLRVNRVVAALGGGTTVAFASRTLSLETVIDLLEQLLTRAKKSRAQGLSLETFIRTLRDQAASN